MNTLMVIGAVYAEIYRHFEARLAMPVPPQTSSNSARVRPELTANSTARLMSLMSIYGLDEYLGDGC